MAYRDTFTAKEWCTLQFTPLWIFKAVAGADGKVDSKELTALSREIANAPLFRSGLAREVLMGIAVDLQSSLHAFMGDGRTVEAGLKQVADLLDKKVSPDDGNDFKKTMIAIGYKVAEASGSWFRSKVSKEEAIALFVSANLLRLPMNI